MSHCKIHIDHIAIAPPIGQITSDITGSLMVKHHENIWAALEDENHQSYIP